MNLIDIIVDIIIIVIIIVIIILSLFFLLLCMDATLNKISDKKMWQYQHKTQFLHVIFHFPFIIDDLLLLLLLSSLFYVQLFFFLKKSLVLKLGCFRLTFQSHDIGMSR